MRKEGLEPSRVSPLDSKSSASTSSATFAKVAGRRLAIIAGSGGVQTARGLQPLQLIGKRIADTALQQAGDVLVELAVLPSQRGNCHDDRRMDMPQAQDCLLERPGFTREPCRAAVSARGHPGPCPSSPSSFWPIPHHNDNLSHLNTIRQYFSPRPLAATLSQDYICAAISHPTWLSGREHRTA